MEESSPKLQPHENEPDMKPHGMTAEQERQLRSVIDDEENRKPLVVTILGQTGVGKSSLLNALFNIRLSTHDSRPCTMQPERHVVRNDEGHELWFWDMPGIGESTAADTEYLKLYKAKIDQSDIVLWACHADSRSVTFEVEALQKLVGATDESEQGAFLSKITFVLTKADLVFSDPWIVNRNGAKALVAAASTTQALLDEKATYFKESLIRPFAEKLVVRTFHDGQFDLPIDGFSFDKHFVYHRGLLTYSLLEQFRRSHPKHAEVFARLYKNSRVVYCSARFKFNLAQLMSVIVERIGGAASRRFRHFTSPKTMNVLEWQSIRQCSNLAVFDERKDQIVFSLEDLK